MKKLLLLAPFALLLLLTHSCKDQSPSKDDEMHFEARSYFSAFTQGMVEPNASIIFRTLRPTTLDSAQLIEGITTEPGFDFKLQFQPDRNEIVIDPKEALERGQTYTLSVELDQWFLDGENKTLTTQFTVFRQHLDVSRKGLLLKGNDRFLEVDVFTSLPETPKSIKSMIDHPNPNTKVTKIDDLHYLVQLKVGDNNEAKITWDGSGLGSEEKGEIPIYQFDSNVFEVINTHYDRQTRQFKVYFSQTIDREQDKTGLITLGQDPASFDIQDNVLTVYITSQVKEDQTLRVERALKSQRGVKLHSSLTYEIEIDIVKPAVQLLSDGNYLPSSGEFKLPIKAKGLKSIKVQVVEIPSKNAVHFVSWNQLSNVDLNEIKRYGRLKLSKEFSLIDNTSQAEQWAEYGLDLSGLFERKDGMVYTLLLSFGPSNTVLECMDPTLLDYEKRQIDASFFDKKHRGYNYNRQNRYYYYGRGYQHKERNNPCHASYYMKRASVITNIHCTNIFPIIKGGNDDWVVAIKELMNNTIAKKAKVELLNLQGTPFVKGSTSSKGIVRFDDVEQIPQALKVTYGGVVSYFNIDPAAVVSMTEFDISSEVKDIDNRIFVYTERNIWRPGDSIFLDIMLNRSKFKFEEGLPITVRLINPKGVLHSKKMKSISEAAIYNFPLKTELESPTGYWKAEIKVGPYSKTQSIRVETIRPNVVDIQFDFEKEEDNWIYNDRFSGDLQVDYLAGYPLKGGKVNISSNMHLLSSPFSDFTSYRFLPYNNDYSKKNDQLLNVKTDEKGHASFDIDRNFKNFNGAFRMLLDCKIDLPGGGLNTVTRTRMVSPFERYVGIKRAKGKGWRGSFKHDEQPDLQLVHINQKGEFLQGKTEAKVMVYKFTKDWWYDRYRLTRGHNYHSKYRKELVHEQTVEFVGGKYNFTHDKERWGEGSFMIVVKDTESGHRSEYKYHNVNSRSYASKINPQILQMQTDTNTYLTGQTIDVNLPVLPEARALVSVETGSMVYDVFWADMDRGKLQLNVEDHWTPNIYLSVHVVQNYGQPQNDNPMRMYAVKKIKINTTEQSLKPKIKAPEKARPNSQLVVEVSEQEGRPMEYTLAIVDHGLLNITGFNTPDPQEHFNKLIALRVKTWDIFSQLIQYMNPSFAGILSIGGDEALNKLMDESADFNRFEPVVFHKGPFQLAAGASKSHTFDIPNYIGKVRVMVVASGHHRYGHEEQNVRIASPLMIQSQLPRALNVSDEVIAPITLFRDEENVQTVQLDLKSKNDLVQFKSGSIRATFESGDQMTTQVPITVKEEAGEAQLHFHASSGKYESTEETKIFVNYPNSYSSKARYLEIPPGESMDIDVSSFGFQETQHFDLVVSGTRVPDFVSFYHSLLKYPHGCVEQIASKGYALLYMDKIVQLSPTERKKAIDHLDVAILKVQSYQRSDGRFNYWPGNYFNVWGDLYAGLFLHEAQSESRTVSKEAIRRWANQNISIANAWRIEGTMTNSYSVRKEENVQAYRLYALAKAGYAQKGAMNRFRERKKLTPLAKAYLAGAYGHAGFPEIGEKLMHSVIDYNEKGDRYYYWGSSVRNRAEYIAISSELFPDLIDRRYYHHWVEDVNKKRWTSTHEKGQIFKACYRYLGDGKSVAKEIDFEVQSDKYNQRRKLGVMNSRRFDWENEEVAGQVRLINHGKSNIYARRIERAIPKELYKPAESNDLEVKVTYSTPYGNLGDSLTLEQGDEININVMVSNTSNVDLDFMALTVRAPSGWELLNPRIFKTAALNSDNFSYQDFRDDKVYTYFKLDDNGPGRTKTYRFKARAQLLGNYYLPSVQAADMYELDVFATTSAKRAIVK